MSPEIPRLTKGQPAIIGAFTGVCMGPFGDIQEYAERKFGRPIWTHEFASADLSAELKEAARADLLSIVHEDAARTRKLDGAARAEGGAE